MINEDAWKGLNLDYKWVERDLQLSQELADGYNILAHHSEGSKREETFLVSASFYRRAAAHALLLGQYGYRGPYGPAGAADVNKLFTAAIDAYQTAGTPYSSFLCIFSPNIYPNESFVTNWLDHLARAESDWHPQLVYLLLYSAVFLPKWRPDNDVLYSIRQGMELYRIEPIGVLGTPISYYLDLIDAMNARTDVDAIEQAISPFLSQYDFAIRQAQKNVYHWQRLAMPFHPAEPDLVGVMLYTNRFLYSLRSRRSVLDMIQESRMEHQTMSLLYGILSHYRKGGGDDAGTLGDMLFPIK
jgi:hypothetical protein